WSKLGIFTLVALPQLASAQNIWEGTNCNTGNNICGFCDMIIVGVNVIDIMMEAAALIVLVMLIWGAFLMMTSAGSQGKYDEGKKKITSAVIGLAITLAAWAIVNTAFMAIASISGASEITWNNIKCK
ncbi:hypothetical protein KBB41_02310, partial [Candidatus Curtissbacteria bacterium]|nr:hypothetical protein [Candidatus Curtissbacteria bacterium]